MIPPTGGNVVKDSAIRMPMIGHSTYTAKPVMIILSHTIDAVYFGV